LKKATNLFISAIKSAKSDTVKQSLALLQQGYRELDTPIDDVVRTGLETGKIIITNLWTVLSQHAFRSYVDLQNKNVKKFDYDAKAVRAYKLLKSCATLQEKMWEYKLLNYEEVQRKRIKELHSTLVLVLPTAVILCILDPYCDVTFDVSETVVELEKEARQAINVAERRGLWDPRETVELRSFQQAIVV